MKHPLSAMTREILGRNKSILGFAVLVTVLAFFVGRADKQLWIAIVKAFAMLFSFAAIFVTASLNEYDKKFAVTGFPPRYFLLPLPTWLLVVWPAILGIVLILINYCVWAFLMFPREDAGFDAHWLLLIISCLFIFQFVLWVVRTITWLKLLIAAVSMFSLVAVFLFFDLQKQSLGLPALASLGLISASQVFFVHRQRSGEGAPGFGFWKFRKWLERSDQPVLKSGFAALQWHEWSRNLRILPMLTIGVTWISFFSFLILGQGSFTRGSLTFQLFFVYVSPIILSAVMGLVFYKSDIFSAAAGLSVQQALLPIPSEELVISKYCAAAKASILAWVSLLPVFLVGFWLLSSMPASNTIDRFAQSIFVNPSFSAGLLVSGLLVSFSCLTALFAFGMIRSDLALRVAALLVFLVFLTLVGSAKWLYQTRPHLFIEALRLCNRIFILLFALKLYVSYWAAARAVKENEMRARTAAGVVLVWLVSALTTGLTTRALLQNFVTSDMAFTAGLFAFFVIPLARTFFAFHSMALQRHQN